jgi:hypothetical protein
MVTEQTNEPDKPWYAWPTYCMPAPIYRFRTEEEALEFIEPHLHEGDWIIGQLLRQFTNREAAEAFCRDGWIQ